MIQPEPQRLASIIESFPDGVAVIDQHWQIILWNKAAQVITHWQAEAVTGSDFREKMKLTRETDRKSNFLAIEQALSTGKAVRQTESTVLLIKDGQEFPVSLTATPLFDREGKVDGAVIVFANISGEKDAFRLRSDFAYLQHQLRTPLTVALWNLQLALESPTLSEDARKLVDTALFSLGSVKALSNRLIEVSGIDQGLTIPKKQPVAIREVVEKSSNAVDQLAKAKSIELVITPSISLTENFSTDPAYCSRILEELLINAIQFSQPNKKVELKIDRHDGGVVFTVVDQGIGIPMGEQSLIFTKFFRGSNVSSTVAGAGLGLYTTLRFVQSLGGKIWFASKENQGASFSVLLPES